MNCKMKNLKYCIIQLPISKISLFCIIALGGFLAVDKASAQGNWDTRPDTWLATDALGRTMPQVAVTGEPRADKIVALFYYLWNGSHTTGLYDISKIIAQDPAAIHEFDSPLWGPEGAWHFWGEPLFGYYFMQDEWVIRRHAQMLTDAGVDLIFLEATNAIPYKGTYDVLFNVYQDMIESGQDVPKIAFLTHFYSNLTVERIYNDVYKPGRHSNLWFYWEGKPLILGRVKETTLDGDFVEMSTTLQDFFTIRHSWAWQPGEDQWGWLEESPQQGGWHGDPSNLEQVPVAAASHPTISHGKSNHIGFQPEPASQSSELGIKFNDQWRRALNLNPTVILCTQWNEWTAQKAQWQGADATYAQRPLLAGDPYFVDVWDDEYNRDIEPMKGGYGDNFYYQMIEGVRKFKGTRSEDPASAPMTISLTNLDAWDAVSPEFRDDKGDIFQRNNPGFGGLTYTNHTGRNDIESCKIARDDSYIYLYVKTVANISDQSSGGEYWMNCYIRDETSSAPNWEGYHFRLANSKPESGEPTLYRSDGEWNWTSMGEMSMHRSNSEMVVAIPRSLLGLPTNSTFAHLSFKWTDNQLEPTSDAWLVNGDAAPNARFRYNYWAPGRCDAPVPGKTFRIHHEASSKLFVPNGDALTSGTYLTTSPNTHQRDQKWTLLETSPNLWVIFNTDAAMENGPVNPIVVEIPDGDNQEGLSVKTATYDSSHGQMWSIVPTSTGWYRILNYASGLALSRTDTGAVVQTSASPSVDQHWSFEPVAPVDAGDKYRLHNRNSRLPVSMQGGGMNSGDPILQHYSTNSWNEQWVTYVESHNRIQIVSEESRRPIQPNGLSHATEAAVVQGDWIGHDAQYWEIRMVEPGYFHLINVASGYILGPTNGDASPGITLKQNTPSLTGTELMWRFSEENPSRVSLVDNWDFSENAVSFTQAPGYLDEWSSGNPEQISGWSLGHVTTGQALVGINGSAATYNAFGPTDSSAASTYVFIQIADAQPAIDNSVSQTVNLHAKTHYEISFLAASRKNENSNTGRVVIQDDTTTYYDSGNRIWNSTAFQSVTSRFSTSSSFDGEVKLILINSSIGGDSTVCYSRVSILPVPVTFDNWIALSNLAPGDQGLSDDPDNDNLPNAIEAWFGSHPGEFSAKLTSFKFDGSTMTFSHPQNKDLPNDLTGFYQWSVDMIDWYMADGADGPQGGPTIDIMTDRLGATVTVTITPSEVLEQLFLRFGVNQN